HPLWGVWLVAFLALQFLRIWVITSLGRYWNTKIIVLRDADIVNKGPYKWFRHPNYIVVTLEFIVIPLIFQAYWTLLIFGLLNQLILFIRIREEERVLRQMTSYSETFDR
ncbi:MAG TPA: isoprenylcysteine carboxylmethyltransferase family protein, partial [Chondromyces sp.]|nr:isoprenylcysteine carboxylmethyltransferase family protein [Chondromyces sp.]